MSVASPRPSSERHRDARLRDEHERRGAPAQRPGVELEPDHEHVEDDAELRDDAEGRARRVRKEIGLDAGRDTAEERGPEQDAGHHLADHRRLAHRREQPAENVAGDEDHGQGQQDMEREIGAHVRRAAAGVRSREPLVPRALGLAHGEVEPEQASSREQQVDADHAREDGLDVRELPICVDQQQRAAGDAAPTRSRAACAACGDANRDPARATGARWSGAAGWRVRRRRTRRTGSRARRGRRLHRTRAPSSSESNRTHVPSDGVANATNCPGRMISAQLAGRRSGS